MDNSTKSQNSTPEKFSQKKFAQNTPAITPPIRMERVDESTSYLWWNEAAGIKMPSPSLSKQGDTILCWVNEGDYIMNKSKYSDIVSDGGMDSRNSTLNREWTGLSDKAKLHIVKLSQTAHILDIIDLIEIELKEKNA